MPGTFQPSCIGPMDPPTYAFVVLILAGTGVLAAYLPARRASAVDPVAILKAG